MASHSFLTMSLSVPGKSGKTLAHELGVTDSERANEGTFKRLAKLIVHVFLNNRAQLALRVDDAGTFSSGFLNDAVSETATVTFASLANDEVTIVAGVPLTWKSSPTTEDHIDLGSASTDTTAGDELAATINAHSKLVGLAAATNAAGVVTIVVTGAGILSRNLVNHDISGGVVFSAANFAPTATFTRVVERLLT